MSQNNPNGQFIQLTGLWLHKTADDELYFSGNLGNGRLLIFKNKHKTKPKHPDYVAYLAPSRPQQPSVSASDFESQASVSSETEPETQPEEQPDDVNGIPF